MSTELERALRSSLEEHARHAPDGAGLAERIITEATLPPNVRSLRPARSWRAWGLPLLAAAAVALVVGLGVGISQWQLGASPHLPSGRSFIAPAPTAPHRSGISSAPAPSPKPSSASRNAPAAATNPVGVSGFRISDVTFVGPDSGFAIGTAVCPGGHGRCSAFVHTTDGGTWTSLPHTPFNVAGVTSGCTERCVSHIRFANPLTGYVYGPDALLMTVDGGQNWTPQRGGALALETLDDNVIRVIQHGSGCPGPCHIGVETSGVGSSSWTSETLPGTVSGDAVQLARTGADAYVLITKNPAGGAPKQQSTLYVSRNDGLHWASAGEPCPQGSMGEVDSTAVAAASGGVTVACGPRRPAGDQFVVTSRDHGAHFARRPGVLPSAVDGLLAGDPGTVLLAGGVGAYRSTDGGRSWSRIPAFGTAQVSFLGFENDHDGRAVTNGGRTIYTTRDAGATWTRYSFP